jgi:phosphatidylserine/phosphatidylglycerophosphate/cardiolipin synthase-like enzyme
LIPEGFNPELDAVGILVHRNGDLRENQPRPNSLITRLMRKGFVHSHKSMHLPPNNQEIETLTGNNLVEFIGCHQTPEIRTLYVVRERLYGSLLTSKVLTTKPSNYGDTPVIQSEPIIPPFEQKDVETDVLSLLKPYQVQLSRLLDVDYHSVPKRVSLIHDIEVETAIIERKFWMRENKDGDHRWIPSSRNCPLSSKLIAKHPSLRIKQQEGESNEWGLSSELKILNGINQFRKINFTENKQLAWQEGVPLAHEIGSILEQYNEELNQTNNQRLQHIEPVVGTEHQQWDAAVKIISSSENDTLILSAFSNMQHTDSIRNRLESIFENRDSELKIHMCVGEPNRINEKDYIDRTKRFALELGRNVSLTTTPSHAKFVISDTGMFWIGSCNLLSAAPGSWNSEVGVLVNDPIAALELLDLVAPWFGAEEKKVIKRMVRTLSTQERTKGQKRDYCWSIAQVLKEASIPSPNSKKSDKKAKGNLLSAISKAQNLIVIAQNTPNYSFILTEQHRSFMIDSIALAERNLSMASDQLRPNGLDLTLENLIIGKFRGASINENERFDLRIYWGRQSPGKYHDDQEIQEGQNLLDALRKKCRKELYQNQKKNRGSFFPNTITGPMNNHGKFLIIDSRRVLITSLNLTGGKNEELDSLDATELGVVIDSPYLAHAIQGEMDLMMPQGFNSQNPPFQLIVNCFAAVMVTTIIDLDDECSLETMLEHFFERVMGTPHLMELWNSYMERIERENSIQQAVKIVKVLDNRGYITAKHRTDSTRLIRIKIIHAEMKKGEYEGDLNDVIVSLRKITLADEAYPILPKAMGDDQENSIAELNEQKSLEQRKSYDEPKGKNLSRKQDFFNPFAPNATANSKIEIRSEKAKEAVSKGFSTRKKKKPAPSNPFARKE